jgi:hypothetical protein
MLASALNFLSTGNEKVRATVGSRQLRQYTVAKLEFEGMAAQ